MIEESAAKEIPRMPILAHSEYPAAGDRLLRMRDLEQLTALSRATIYRAIKAGEVPPSVRIGGSARWVLADIPRLHRRAPRLADVEADEHPTPAVAAGRRPHDTECRARIRCRQLACVSVRTRQAALD